MTSYSRGELSEYRSESVVDQAIIERFEAAWRHGEAPDIRDFVRCIVAESGNSIHRELLEELIMIDIESRWRLAYSSSSADAESGEAELAETTRQAPLVEAYSRQFAELGNSADLRADLIAEEYHARQCWGDHPSVLEYHKRFPHQWPALHKAIERLARDFVDAKVKVYHRGQPLHVTGLPTLLEIGRQRDGEPAPCKTIHTELGQRLIIAPVTDRSLSRQHLICEPCGRQHVRVTCTSQSKSVTLPEGDSLRTDQSRKVRLPCLITLGTIAIRLE